MDDIDFSPSELSAASVAYTGLQTTVSNHGRTHTSLHVADDVFGCFPGISDDLRGAYGDHERACAESLGEAAECIGDFASAFADAASWYQDMEKYADRLVAEIMEALG